MSDKDWYYKVTNNWNELPSFIEYFTNEAYNARSEIVLKGRLEENSKNIPVHTERRFTQLQIVNALVRYFEIELDKERSVLYKKYMEGYAKSLSSKDATMYIDGEETIVNLNRLINEICLVRNIFTGIIKGLDNKSYQLNNISKLRSVGLESSTVD